MHKLFSVFVFSLFLSFVGINAHADQNGAKQFVDDLGKKVLNIINNKAGSESERQKQLQDLFIANVDTAWMGQFALGTAWNSASEAERQQYLDTYKQYMLVHYTKNFSSYTGSQYTITGVKPEADNQYTVNMKINTPQESQDTLAGYRVKDMNGQYKITDIVVEGVSMIMNQRSDFNSITQQKGVNGLIEAIQNKEPATK